MLGCNVCRERERGRQEREKRKGDDDDEFTYSCFLLFCSFVRSSFSPDFLSRARNGDQGLGCLRWSSGALNVESSGAYIKLVGRQNGFGVGGAWSKLPRRERNVVY